MVHKFPKHYMRDHLLNSLAFSANGSASHVTTFYFWFALSLSNSPIDMSLRSDKELKSSSSIILWSPKKVDWLK